MLDFFDVPSFDSPSSPYGCVSFSDAPSVALSLIYAHSFALSPRCPRIGDLDKINPNLKRFQIINHFLKYFTRITLFGRAIHGGVAEGGATPLPLARQWLPRKLSGSRPASAAPLVVARHKCLRRHC
jgi:hypothetical protein